VSDRDLKKALASLADEDLDLIESFLPGSAGRKIPPTYQPHYSDIVLIPRDKIIIPADRQRGGKLDGKDDDYEGGETIKGLRNSIKRFGFAGAILVTKFDTPEGYYKLVYGNRRAVASAGLRDTIPSQIVTPHPDDPNPKATLEQIEHNEDIVRLQRDPLTVVKSRARIAKLYEDEGQSRERIAEALGIEETTLSDNINNAEFMERHPDLVAHCKTDKEVREARSGYERAQDQKRLEDLEALMGIKKPAPKYEILTGDFNVWAPAYTGPAFDFVFVDFPWGIGQHTFNQSSRTTARYEDTPEVFDRLCGTLRNHQDRFIAKQAHMIFFFNIGQYHEIRTMLEAMGWRVNPHPLIWAKPTKGITPVDKRDPRQCYEAAFLCTRGDRKLIESKRNWSAGDPPNPNEREHQSEKNAEALLHFLSMVVDETTRVLDPTCGSGVAIRVAKKLGVAYALGLEINDQSRLLAQAKLDAEK
jgi:ParB-like chromosome segregation protein Spo0J